MEKSPKQKPKRKKVESPFAKNLGLILRERGLSQKSAAEIMGISVSVVNDWIHGTQPSDHHALLRLCKAISCDFQWLLTGTRSNPVASTSNLHEVFDVQDDPMFSGVFMIEAKRLKVKKATNE